MNIKTFRALIAVSIVMLAAMAAYGSGPGSLDLSFNGTGFKLDTFTAQQGFEGGYKTLVQTDGKILVAVGGWSLARYNPDGTPDLSFGTGGKVITTFGISFIQIAIDMALQPDGKIVVAGFREPAAGLRNILMVRYNSDGALDTAFGTNGKVTTLVDGVNSYATNVAVQPDSKIVIAAAVYHPVNIVPYVAIVRYNTEGTLDTSFDSDGIATTHAVNSFSGSGLIIQPDGKIVTAGESVNGNSSLDTFALARFNANGSPDTSFHSDGVVTTQMGPNSSVVRALAIMPDGRIVAGGYAYDAAVPDIDMAFARYTVNGLLDASFGSDGKVFTHITPDYDYLGEMALQSDGKLLATVFASVGPGDMRLLRYNTNGSLDSAYGSGGQAVIDVGSNEYINSVALDGSGRAVVVGYSYSTTSTLIARVTAEQSPLVDVGGRVTNSFGQGISGVSMVLSGANGGSRYALTNGFGYYVFPFVSSNEIYTVSTSSKRYTFLPEAHTVTLLESVLNVDFTGTPNENTRGAVTAIPVKAGAKSAGVKRPLK
ncbi:MAG TPA: hypothetical protein VGO50_20615 [Pyrinomonadaceae bacterium]|jgi:uncharacterized delta-60 repeat protein|nr:hypothetical protein [Pyrinomonadaceae bacterium]